MGKKALLVGCNYPGTKAELKGCVNDVKRMHNCLIDRYCFNEEDITVLIDTNDRYKQPTGINIRRELSRLVRSAEPGDVLFFHYSGHGTRLPAETGDHDDTGYDECIVPCDMNLITDDDIRELVDKVPDGCRITIVSDSCHSGQLIDAEKEQIGESTIRRESNSSSGFRNFLHQTIHEAFQSSDLSHGSRRNHHQPVEGEINGKDGVRSRSLPLPVLVDLLKQQSGNDDLNVGMIRPTLFNMFGDNSSNKVKKFMRVLVDKVQGESGENTSGDGFLSMVGNLAKELLKQKLEENEEGYAGPALRTKVHCQREAYPGIHGNALPDMGILISGCQTDQTSADIDPGDGQAYGALSNAIQAILSDSEQPVTNKELVIKARELLRGQRFTQRPGLYCSDDHLHLPFVC